MKDAKEIAKEFMARFPLGLAQRNEYAIRFVSELIELVRKESKEQVITQGSMEHNWKVYANGWVCSCGADDQEGCKRNELRKGVNYIIPED